MHTESYLPPLSGRGHESDVNHDPRFDGVAFAFNNDK